jgi:hypothetical protein
MGMRDGQPVEAQGEPEHASDRMSGVRERARAGRNAAMRPDQRAAR